MHCCLVDINSIPSSMIKRVEIISGGASATYGADAIGGVSNFILRRDFQGLEVDAQWGTTEAGDGDEMRASAILGTSFSEGRGNLVLSSDLRELVKIECGVGRHGLFCEVRLV